MTQKFISLQTFRLLALVVVMVSVVVIDIHPGYGEPGAGDDLELEVNDTVERIWERSDGPVLRGVEDRAWLWGPEPVSIATEFYPESSTGTRTLVYYDKGRLDIRDINADPSQDWYAVGGLLVHEMLVGRVQLGDDFFVARPTPDIPLTGDFNQPVPVTYATLAPFTSVWQVGLDGSDPVTGDDRSVSDRTGEIVMASLGGDSWLIPNAVTDSTVQYGQFDPKAGHNVADVFVDWNAAQPYHELYLLGHAISEPYWINTVIEGQPERVLIQAFERRLLTYRPENPEGWKVESTNAGNHYRAWRGLSQITDPAYMPLAAGEPFGEEIVGAAVTWNVNPFMLAAISQVASKGNPRDFSGNGGSGLLAVHPELHDVPGPAELADPAVNAEHGARALAFWMPEGVEHFDWRGVLANYYTHGSVDWSDEALERFVHDVLETYGDLKEQYPRLEADPLRHEVWGGVLDRGPAAHYDPSYTTPWWERTQLLYASKGVIAPDYEPDPNGYYCVRPGYVPGERLHLRANGVTITCTIGDMVADHDLYNWLLVSNWSVELSWSAFTALGLQHSNYVEVDYPGTWAKSPPPIPPPAPEPVEPEPAPEATPEPTPEPGSPPAGALPASPEGPADSTPDPDPEPPAED
ncbi:hypothetical protein BH23CHL2_BH23CHL2_33150 [soil metagenome]